MASPNYSPVPKLVKPPKLIYTATLSELLARTHKNMGCLYWYLSAAEVSVIVKLGKFIN